MAPVDRNLLCAWDWSSPDGLGLNGVLYAQPAADILTAVVTVFMALNLHRKLTAEESHIILQSQKQQ